MRYFCLALIFLNGCSRSTIHPDAADAADRVRAFIVDAYQWELDAAPPRPPELDRKLQDALRAAQATGKIPQSDAIVRMMQGRGKAVLANIDDIKLSLDALGEKHWVGDTYRHEIGSLQTPPKHDPTHEQVTSARILGDGSAEVVTEIQTGQVADIIRTYRVESIEDDWRIRSYVETFPDGR